MPTGLVFNIQKYSVQDGPGIRTTVFFKGCPLRCPWCHNPESIAHRPEILATPNRCLTCGQCRTACPFGLSLPGQGPLPSNPAPCTLCGACLQACPTGARRLIGHSLSVPQVLAEVLKDRIFYDDSGGGVTLSGGEPLQQPRFLVALLTALRDAGLHTALDTTGYGPAEPLLAAATLSHLVLYDLKAFDDRRHRHLTGVSNHTILRNLHTLAHRHSNLWIRLPIVPGYTDQPQELDALAHLVAQLPSVRRVSLLPFHRSGLHKYERLGYLSPLDHVTTPSLADLERAAAPFHARHLPVHIGG